MSGQVTFEKRKKMQPLPSTQLDYHVEMAKVILTQASQSTNSQDRSTFINQLNDVFSNVSDDQKDKCSSRVGKWIYGFAEKYEMITLLQDILDKSKMKRKRDDERDSKKKKKFEKFTLKERVIDPIDVAVMNDDLDGYMNKYRDRSFHICCGVKGSGKTTFFQKNAENMGLTYIPIDLKGLRGVSYSLGHSESILAELIKDQAHQLFTKMKRVDWRTLHLHRSQEIFMEIGQESVYQFKNNQKMDGTKFLLHFDNLSEVKEVRESFIFKNLLAYCRSETCQVIAISGERPNQVRDLKLDNAVWYHLSAWNEDKMVYELNNAEIINTILLREQLMKQENIIKELKNKNQNIIEQKTDDMDIEIQEIDLSTQESNLEDIEKKLSPELEKESLLLFVMKGLCGNPELCQQFMNRVKEKQTISNFWKTRTFKDTVYQNFIRCNHFPSVFVKEYHRPINQFDIMDILYLSNFNQSKIYIEGEKTSSKLLHGFETKLFNGWVHLNPKQDGNRVQVAPSVNIAELAQIYDFPLRFSYLFPNCGFNTKDRSDVNWVFLRSYWPHCQIDLEKKLLQITLNDVKYDWFSLDIKYHSDELETQVVGKNLLGG